jgi:hypothetical protein
MKLSTLFFFLVLFNLSSHSQSPVIEWTSCWDGAFIDRAYSVDTTFDGGYIVAGKSSFGGGDDNDYSILKLDASGNIIWQKLLGFGGLDVATSIQQTIDGGYVVAGYTSSNDGDITGNHGGTYDGWVVKMNAIGTIEWQKALGGTSWDEIHDIKQTSDGGFVISGFSDSNDGDVSGNHAGSVDYWVVKLDELGNIIWQRFLGGTYQDEAYSIQQTTDGGYIVAGYTNSLDGDVSNNNEFSSFWIIKLDPTGNISWEKSPGGDYAYSIKQTIDGGFIAVGMAQSTFGNDNDYFIIKLDTDGEISWQKSLGGSFEDQAYSIDQTTDGGYIISGQSNSIDQDVTNNLGFFDCWVVKLDESGNLIWQKSLGGASEDSGDCIKTTSDGGCIVVGYTDNSCDSFNQSSYANFLIVKLASETTSNIMEFSQNVQKKSIRIVNIFGQETSEKPNELFFYLYNDGSVEKKIMTE